MTKVISVINQKGGVGKTTTTVALAEFLAEEFKRRVLVVDMDPQSNATVMLMDEENWLQRERQGLTVCQIFQDKYDHDKPPRFQLDQAIVPEVSNIGGGLKKLSLLPSSLSFIKVQELIRDIPMRRQFARDADPFTILGQALAPALPKFDFVLLDCPPNLSIVTFNALLLSDFYLIPCMADHLSTLGIPELQESIAQFRRSRDLPGNKMVALGIVFNRFNRRGQQHEARRRQLLAENAKNPHLHPQAFDSLIPDSNKVGEAAKFGVAYRNIKKKYETTHAEFRALTQEVLDRVGA